MQPIGEAYDIMKNILGMGNDEMSEVCCIQSTSAHEDRDEER